MAGGRLAGRSVRVFILTIKILNKKIASSLYVHADKATTKSMSAYLVENIPLYTIAKTKKKRTFRNRLTISGNSFFMQTAVRDVRTISHNAGKHIILSNIISTKRQPRKTSRSAWVT